VRLIRAAFFGEEMMNKAKSKAKAPKGAKAKPPTLAELEAAYDYRRGNLIRTMSDPDGLTMGEMPSIDDADEWLIGIDLSDEDAVAELDYRLDTIWQYGVNYTADAQDLREALKALSEAKAKMKANTKQAA
jgi:hypothetical protein